jgi:hypothetical protein
MRATTSAPLTACAKFIIAYSFRSELHALRACQKGAKGWNGNGGTSGAWTYYGQEVTLPPRVQSALLLAEKCLM